MLFDGPNILLIHFLMNSSSNSYFCIFIQNLLFCHLNYEHLKSNQSSNQSVKNINFKFVSLFKTCVKCNIPKKLKTNTQTSRSKSQALKSTPIHKTTTNSVIFLLIQMTKNNPWKDPTSIITKAKKPSTSKAVTMLKNTPIFKSASKSKNSSSPSKSII